MQSFKRISALILSVIFVFAMMFTASAYDIVLESDATTPTEGHVYDIYQIFRGTLAEGVLVDIKYGANYLPDGKTTDDAVASDVIDQIGDDARAFAKKLLNEQLITGEPVAVLSAENDWTAKDLEAGYYLVNEQYGEDVPAGQTISAYIVKVLDDVKMTPKSGITSIDKIISGDNNSIDGDITLDGKFDNVSVGTNVQFLLTAPVLTNAKDFDFCYFIINDTLCPGFTFNNDISVTIGGEPAVLNEDYTVFTGDEADGYTFRVALLDARSHSGQDVEIRYSAELNDKAVIGELDGNPNEADLFYSNNPNFDYANTHTGGKPSIGQNVPLGETVKVYTRTYTTGIKVVKVDENGNALKGAKFELKGENVTKVIVKREVFTESENGIYWLLNNGFYTKDAPLTEAKYVVKTDNRDSGYVLDGEAYRVATNDELADESVTLYTMIEPNSNLYNDIYTKYEKTVEPTYVDVRTDKKIEAEVGENGVIIFEGLGEGTYTVTETVTPAGYNTIKAFDVVVSWEAPEAGSDDCKWTVSAFDDGKPLSINEEGVFELTVVNHSGIKLPDTGGIGTTIFYIVGGVLVACAVVLLVTRRRMNKYN